MPRTDWSEVVNRAATIVDEYDTPVTLRQLFYRLVADGTLPNIQTAYKTLSARTAEARRRGSFPELIDRTRTIHRGVIFRDPGQALRWLVAIYERDRTGGQEVSLYLGVEKAGIVEQLRYWFGDFGLPVLALGGYASQSYVDEVVRDVEHQGRTAVLLYAGDFDPSGEDIRRDFIDRTDCWDEVVQVALSAEQVAEYNLPPYPGKRTDSRAVGFEARHGRLVQVEVDALPPNALRDLFNRAVMTYLDKSILDEVMEIEAQDQEALEKALAVI